MVHVTIVATGERRPYATCYAAELWSSELELVEGLHSKHALDDIHGFKAYQVFDWLIDEPEMDNEDKIRDSRFLSLRGRFEKTNTQAIVTTNLIVFHRTD